MPSTRRSLLGAMAVGAGSLLAGCNDGQESETALQYEVYVRNETGEPYEITVEVLDDADESVYTEDGDGVLTPDEAEFFGPFDEQPATIRVVSESLHDDEDAKTWSTAYQAPDEECTNIVLNRLFLEPDDVQYDTRCKEY